MAVCAADIFVTPAQAGVQGEQANPAALDSRLRGNDARLGSP